MKFYLKKISVFIIIAMLCGHAVHAFDLDETVNDEIRKNYNDTKLIEDSGVNFNSYSDSADESLPDLPNITKTQSQSKSADVKSTQSSVPKTIPSIPYTGGNKKVAKGTSFAVVNTGAISDWQTIGATVKFKLKNQQSGKSYVIPSGTIFTGEIVESHQPQITCNGGLVAIRVYSMIYKGQTVPLSGYVIRAKDKKVFFNDIKGERTYLKTMWKKGNWGRSLFNRMLSLTVNLGSSNSTLVLSPFPIVYGTICLGANTLVSPITAFFSKGGHVSIPAGSNFVLKLSEPVYID